MSVSYVYKQLRNNESVTFDSTNEGNEVVCKNNRDHTVSNVSYLTRACKYIRSPEDEICIN